MGEFMSSSSFRVATALGAATLVFSTPATAQANGWKTLTGYPNCVMQYGPKGNRINIRNKKQVGARINVDLPSKAVRQPKGRYRGTAVFNGGATFIADDAVISELFGGQFSSMNFSNPDFMRLMKSKSSVTFRIGRDTWGPYSLKGSSKVATDFMRCAGIALQPNSVAKGNGKTGVDPQRAVGRGVTREVEQMIDTAIYRDSRSWAFNRYSAGSVRDASITEVAGSSDFTVRAYYTYNRNRTGFVDVYFIRGKIDCLRFHDNRMNCKPAR